MMAGASVGASVEHSEKRSFAAWLSALVGGRRRSVAELLPEVFADEPEVFPQVIS